MEDEEELVRWFSIMFRRAVFHVEDCSTFLFCFVFWGCFTKQQNLPCGNARGNRQNHTGCSPMYMGSKGFSDSLIVFWCLSGGSRVSRWSSEGNQRPCLKKDTGRCIWHLLDICFVWPIHNGFGIVLGRFSALVGTLHGRNANHQQIDLLTIPQKRRLELIGQLAAIPV